LPTPKALDLLLSRKLIQEVLDTLDEIQDGVKLAC
jgi:hypothetical protein